MIYPNALTDEELFRFAQAEALQAQLKKEPWTPIQRELLARYMKLFVTLHANEPNN